MNPKKMSIQTSNRLLRRRRDDGDWQVGAALLLSNQRRIRNKLGNCHLHFSVGVGERNSYVR